MGRDPPPLPGELAELAARRHALLAEAAREPLPRLADLPGDAARVLACSEYVLQASLRDASLLEGLLASGDLASSYAPGAHEQRVAAALEGVASEDALMRALRVLRHREWVRIAWRDIGALASLEETLTDTSSFADAVIGASLARLAEWQHERLGVPRDADGEAQSLVVLALGKLGAGELNFSSDIDLVFAFPRPGTTDGTRRELSNDEFFVRLGRRLIKVLNERTTEGFVFRVDMRLRPFGSVGPLALSFDALEDYYQSHGRDWERYALIRARAVTGDRARADRLLERLRPFVYRRYLDFGALESLRDMKTLIEDEIARKGLADDIKLGPGGIREIEFTGQAFQMVRGGREPSLRDRRILSVIARLGELGYLPRYAVDDLAAAYRFLRTTEHRLQQVADRQVHTLPADAEGRARLAAGMGYADWQAFAHVLAQHRTRVNAQFAQVFGSEVRMSETDEELVRLWTGDLADESAARVLAAAGFDEGEAAREVLARFAESYTLKLLDERGRRRLQRLMPDLLRAVGAQPNALQTLQRILQIIESIARRSSYLALLVERPLALSQLVQLCAASPWIARLLGRHPLLLDELLSPDSLYVPLGREALSQDLRERLAALPPGDVEQEMECLRQFKQASVLHVAAADVASVMPLMKVSDHLTEIAEICLEQVLELAWRDMAARYGEPRCGEEGAREVAPFAIVAYGKLAGLELGYGSDLDVVFVHGSHGPSQRTDGPREVENDMFFSRMAQRIVHYLTTYTAEGTLYELDFRLRPSGAKGLLVNGIEGLRSYLLEEAWTWEHQALVRARVVAGDAGLGRRFAEIRREVLLLERDPEKLRREVRDMRERMRRELGSGAGPGLDLKQDPGCIADIEFMVQYGALRWAGRLGDYLDYPDNIRLLEGFAAAGLMRRDEVEFLTDAYRTYRARVHALALQEETIVEGDGELDHYREGVLRIWRELMED
ncbi:MAG: bifunctional [glutamate--ammonia ligase]-adenylyl-L-tyrosine phosphorylase/[glutamate--ammonia-ligase] adenylyltransferase [Gammaproteobacteria bacterium]|nr:bifunctional [glutamate--ammonia ligase]-adenylyl-L-tyrosine phosphorylase/[glutamate--ammonia-ligase] adenylyltransferase [Gammaproteobacteria bacterium]